MGKMRTAYISSIQNPEETILSVDLDINSKTILTVKLSLVFK
jgi:hypothetical protein